MESLRHDSAVTLIRKDLLKNDLEREQKKFTRSLERMNNLVVTAPIAGQLSFAESNSGATGRIGRKHSRNQSARPI